jgi:hypothetical protein
MKYKYIFIIPLLIVSLSLAINNEIVPGRLLVQFQNAYRGQIKSEIIDGIAVSNIPAVDQLNHKWQVYKMEKVIRDPNPSELAKEYGMDLIYCLSYPEKNDVNTILNEYSSTGVFRFVDPDLIRKADIVPNDPLYSGQWHLPKIQCPTAWDIVHGDSLVTALIIDCGVDYLHNDLTHEYAVNNPEDINHNHRFDPTPASQGGDLDGIDQDGNGYADDVLGYNFLNGNANPYPIAGDDHATECAGVYSATTNNGIGVAGISWGCRYVSAKCGTGGYIYSTIAALYYAVSRQVWAISMSYGGATYQSIEDNAIQYTWAAGCVPIASAGNSYSGGALRYPAGYPNVISCAATDAQDHRSNWGGGQESNYGTWIDVAAPGSSVLTCDPGNGYGAWDGTSFSCPCVVGEAMLIKSAMPSITNAQCTTRIFQSCDSMSTDPQYLAGLMGHGRINVTKAIAQSIRCNLRTIDVRLNDGNNNYPEPNENVAIITTLSNELNYQNATNVSATISCSDADITVTKNTATFPPIPAGDRRTCSADSFVFHVDANAIPHRVRFIVNVSATPPSLHTTDTFYLNVVYPRILIVDDDAGADYERWYKESIDSLKTLYRLWTVATAGEPTLDTLMHYPVVVWFTGLDSLNTLSASDQNNLTSYLNAGKNLFLCGQNIGQNIGTTTFYSNYLHASYVTTHTATLYAIGVPGDPIGGTNGDTVVLGGSGGAANATSIDGIRPVNGAFGCFRYRNYSDTTVVGVVRYSGSYKVVYFGMPFEAIDHATSRYIQKWDVMRRILSYFNEPLPGIEQEQPQFENNYTRMVMQISPNPFTNNTCIRFSLPSQVPAQINIYNITGTLVKSISTSNSSIIWNGTDQNDRKLKNGVYFCEIKTSNNNITQKVIISR